MQFRGFISYIVSVLAVEIYYNGKYQHTYECKDYMCFISFISVFR